MQSIYMVLTAAEKAAEKADVKALEKARQDALRIAAQSTGPFYLRALNVKRYIDDLLIDATAY